MRDLASLLKTKRENSVYRQRLLSESPVGAEVSINGESLLNFCSNDYLGLANDPRLLQACTAGIAQYGVGSGASQLITGYQTAHHELELALADFLERPRVLLFSTGYMANVGVISTLLQKGDHVIEDRLNHASLIDGARMSDARLYRFPHQSMTALDNTLSKISANQTQALTMDQGSTSSVVQKLVVSDAVFSMDGDLADINALVQCAQANNADLMIDDAHGLGVLGDQGRGSLALAGLRGAEATKSVPILVGTFGKAFGTFGAFVAGGDDLIETLIQEARSFIYTTAPPAAIAVATLVSLKIIQEEEWRREALAARIIQLQSGLQQLGLTPDKSPSAIQPIITGSSDSAIKLSHELRQLGFLISAIRPPTVPNNTARLRITLSALHTEQHIDRLLLALDKLKVEKWVNHVNG
ncbi:8-amino-7-oxononanoate synthase [hydrothermal vent metagenome]|uniref:8-amino-7-oxononanoate synthase n=1 Tax=hydrothermal vent metagenome TaxID=652676 RepID=A0A3B0YIA8_9ZZZZ